LVTQRKFERELERWDANADAYRRRGWVMLAREDLSVDIAFTAKVSLLGQVASVVAAAVRINFANYDLWAPSVTFIDLAEGTSEAPPMRAITQTADGPRDLLIDRHPLTELPFLCVPGTREYHSHPQHSGDDWLLHRTTGAGRLLPLCDLLWRTMAQNVVGVQSVIQTIGGAAQVQLRIVQGDPSATLPEPGAM
jgi:hypothetical protein